MQQDKRWFHPTLFHAYFLFMITFHFGSLLMERGGSEIIFQVLLPGYQCSSLLQVVVGSWSTEKDLDNHFSISVFHS